MSYRFDSREGMSVFSDAGSGFALPFAVAAGRCLDHRRRARREAERAHVAGRMRADVAHRVDHLGAEQRGRQPRVQRAGHPVLPDDEPRERRAERVLHELRGLHVVRAEHLPVGEAARRADRGGGGDPRVVRQLVDAHQFGAADRDRERAEFAAVVGPAAAAACENRTALDGGFDVFRRQNASHVSFVLRGEKGCTRRPESLVWRYCPNDSRDAEY